jgi:hypothetical protein
MNATILLKQQLKKESMLIKMYTKPILHGEVAQKNTLVNAEMTVVLLKKTTTTDKVAIDGLKNKAKFRNN